MRFRKPILLALSCLFLACGVAEAQHKNGKNAYSHSRMGFKSPKVRGQKAKLICPVFDKSQYPYHGIGFKLGDPFALTYKYYPNKKFSFAVDFGKASSGLYNSYFREKFQGYALQAKDTLSDNSSLSYTFHR